MKGKKATSSVNLHDIYDDYASALGKEVKELTDTEKRLAMKETFLEVADKVKDSRG